MPDFIVPPAPQVQISDADPLDLPLDRFHLLAVVEPDPESWMVLPTDAGNFHALLETHCALIEEELFPEEGGDFDLVQPENAAPLEAPFNAPKMLWVGGGADPDMVYHYQAIAGFWAYVIFSNDYDRYDDLRYYIQGIAAQHPDWRVAVIGAMYEDDVMRVANAIQEAGLNVTVLTRYCISGKEFVNLDDVMSLRSELRDRGMLEEDDWDELTG